MKELYVLGPNQIECREAKPLAPLKADEVSIELMYGGICGSDLGVFKGSIKHASYPVRPGHELLGNIIEVGSEVNHKVGTKVVVMPNTFCGECEWCLQGKTNICQYKQSIGVNADGGFAERFTISAKYVLPIPEHLSDQKAILIEPFAVIVHAFEKITIKQNTTVAVVGCGNEGMLAAILANFLGANVTAIDINEEKLEFVNQTWGIDTRLADQIKVETFDIVIEAAGTKASAEQGFKLVKQGGAIVLIGMAPEASLPVMDMVRKEITLFGSIIYQFPTDFSKAVQFLQHDDFNAEPVISKLFPFAEYEAAYEHALSGKYGKIILDFTKK